MRDDESVADLKTLTTLTFEAINNPDDEFGDDKEALIASALESIVKPSASTSKTTNVNTSTTSPLETTVKRRKVSPTNDQFDNIDLFDNINQVDTSEKALLKTLSSVFGYNEFREGQLEAIQHALKNGHDGDNNNNDVAVYWPTGGGKSLCYILPAYHTKNITLVISPLISLMEDQVHKLNGLSSTGEDVATFLGSGQMDRNKEQEALEGKYLIVYLTPEKLLSGSFLQQLNTLHTTKKQIGLVAIDESHCVSEWGHDFRPEYRMIGSAFRGPESPLELQQIPIMALTATAVPRVQEDIIRTLDLKNPYISCLSFDRPNLIISVHKKDRNMAMASAMEPLLQTLVEKRHQQESTIIYAPTKNQVEEITSFLRQRLERLGRPDIQVEGYHAGMSHDERSRAHTNFLTGKTTVICATIAFGMGIDKPDTRRVVHFGAPSSVEAYYQQIGRAGRDGQQAEVTMYISEADFDRYKGDFYMGGLQGEAKTAAVAAVDALKAYSLDTMKCRRRALLEAFSETPTYERCGTCDTCTKLRTMDAQDLERDFPASRVVLEAIQALDQPSASTILSVVGGKSVESYRYKPGMVESTVKASLKALKEKIDKKKMSQEAFRDLISPLVQCGYLTEASNSANVGGFNRTWATYSVTNKGVEVLSDQSLPIVLPVPASVLEAEKIEKARRAAVVQRLKDKGVQVDKLPKEEVEAGDGIVIRAYSKWHSYLESMRRNGETDRVSHLEELLTSIETWRSEVAINQRMAPGAVLAEHTLLSICYTVATMPKGVEMEEDDLVAAGVRTTREIASLSQSIADWVEKYQKPDATDCDGSAQSGKNEASMQLTPGQKVKGKGPWEFAVYKAVKKTGLASWESSYNRFSEGENPTAIATSQASGRPIQVQTVCGHLMTALLHGKAVDLSRLATVFTPPTAREWDQLQEAEISTGIDVCGNPVNSGVGGGKFTKTEFLRPIMGSEFIDTPSNERDEAGKVKFSLWCNRLEWYMTLRRVGIEPTFESE